MSKVKSTKKVFTLEEENGVVKATLKAAEDFGIDMIIEEVPNVRVRSPRPTEQHLREMASLWARTDPNFDTEDEWLKFYANGMNQQIIAQLQEIRKSMKRIQSLSCCIKTAQKIAIENANKT